ncbi:DEAD/DEAH box helicase family protein [Streptomyces sp. NPDC032161]|uniref:DEAD/DEAH box helicase family protein n=1 Tax=unclassified Streptomyces TaxID=2593676 RepID=UPI00341087C3
MSRLWPHQVEAVDAVLSAIGRGGRTSLIAACGTGKTRIGGAVGSRLESQGRVLVVVPTIELLVLTLAAYRLVRGGHLGQAVAVCSDTTIADMQVRLAAAARHGHLPHPDRDRLPPAHAPPHRRTPPRQRPRGRNVPNRPPDHPRQTSPAAATLHKTSQRGHSAQERPGKTVVNSHREQGRTTDFSPLSELLGTGRCKAPFPLPADPQESATDPYSTLPDTSPCAPTTPRPPPRPARCTAVGGASTRRALPQSKVQEPSRGPHRDRHPRTPRFANLSSSPRR